MILSCASHSKSHDTSSKHATSVQETAKTETLSLKGHPRATDVSWSFMLTTLLSQFFGQENCYFVSKLSRLQGWHANELHVKDPNENVSLHRQGRVQTHESQTRTVVVYTNGCDQTIRSTNIDLSTRSLDTASTEVLGKLLVSLCQQRREAHHDATFLHTEKTSVSEHGQRNNVVEIVRGFSLQKEVPVRPCLGVFPCKEMAPEKARTLDVRAQSRAELHKIRT